ncbi:uncharacterized protein LOC108744987 [Agrilus planipennis]|uniref:Uncharacterized protein LOC108744987 n=1 Tax=Agrilus planipennis TaxID=224129 RepID=A0A7F5RND3_AGRPL|nr:uncharacterized protein LOC108744987 [Agrilus planipennis]
MSKQLFAIVFLALISISYSQYISRGQCEDRKIKPVKNYLGINSYSFAGLLRRWFTVFTFNIAADCQVISYRNIGKYYNESEYTLTQKDVINDKWLPGSNGVATSASDNGEGIINVKPNNATDSVQFKILAFDSTSYTVDYNCVNIDSNYRREILYARTRYRSYTEKEAKLIDEVLKENGLADIERTYIYQEVIPCL